MWLVLAERFFWHMTYFITMDINVKTHTASYSLGLSNFSVFPAKTLHTSWQKCFPHVLVAVLWVLWKWCILLFYYVCFLWLCYCFYIFCIIWLPASMGSQVSDMTVIEQQQQQQMGFGVLFGVVSPETHPVINSPTSDCISLTYIFNNCQNIHIHLLIHEVREFTVLRPTGSH